MAPDKIYMTPSYEEPDSVLLASFSKSHLYGHRDIEYIRKDALIEWIQEARAVPHENAIVRDLAFQEVINKLNLM